MATEDEDLFRKDIEVRDITLITTYKHNVGDDFVREGILYLLEKKLGAITTSFVHKHIPLTARPEWEWFYDKGLSRFLNKMPKARGLFWSRIIDLLPLNAKTDKILNCDLLVQSGAPVYWAGAHGNEWYGPLVRRRHQHVKHRIPFINLGAGACASYHSDGMEIIRDPKCAAYIKELYSACSVTTLRDSLSKRLLNALGLDAPVIPCPSIFAADRLHMTTKEPEYVALNYMPLGGHFSFEQMVDAKKWEGCFVALYRSVSRKYPVLLVCHDAQEYRQVKRMLPEARCFLATTAEDYLACYSRAKFFIGNRVHGAYAVAAFGRPALVVGNDTRAHMMDEIGLASVYVGDVDAESLLAHVYEMDQPGVHSQIMKKIKQQSLDRYMEALDNIL